MCIDPSTTELGLITEDENLSLVQYQSSTSTFLCFNTSVAPGNDKNLRLAIAHAINIDDIIMVGDRLYTDIRMAVDSDVMSIAVLSGETTREDIDRSDIKPTFICGSVADILRTMRDNNVTGF